MYLNAADGQAMLSRRLKSREVPHVGSPTLARRPVADGGVDGRVGPALGGVREHARHARHEHLHGREPRDHLVTHTTLWQDRVPGPRQFIPVDSPDDAKGQYRVSERPHGFHQVGAQGEFDGLPVKVLRRMSDADLQKFQAWENVQHKFKS